MSKPTLDLGPAVASIEEVASTEGAKTKVTKGAYTEFMGARGISKEVLDQQASAHRELYGAIAIVAGSKLKKDIDAAKDRGDDPSALRHVVEVTTHGGGIQAEVSARSISSNPRAGVTGGDAKIIKHGGTTLKVRVKSQIPAEAVDANLKLIGAAMEGVAIPSAD